MMRNAAGFTLIEVLVAMTVMAVMAMMAWQGVDGIVRARDANQGRLEQTLRLNSVIGQWEQDLASIQDSGVVPAFACDGSTVRLTRRAEGAAGGRMALRPDAMRRAGGAGRADLSRPSANCRTAAADPAVPGRRAGQLRALEGLSAWQVYSYARSGNCHRRQCGGGAPAPSGPLTGPPRTAQTAARSPIVLTFAVHGQNGMLTRDYLVTP